MNWRDVLNVSLVVIGSLGGGGLIVFGLSGFLGRIWIDRLKGEIDAKLHRLDALPEHGNFLLQRFAEFELEAITECWRAARACLPLLNATRPYDSGTNEDVLVANAKLLGEAHNVLLAAVGRHEPFLAPAIVEELNAIGYVVRLELSHISHHARFKDTWWEDGEKNRVTLQAHSDALLALVQARMAQLRAKAEEGLKR